MFVKVHVSKFKKISFALLIMYVTAICIFHVNLFLTHSSGLCFDCRDALNYQIKAGYRLPPSAFRNWHYENDNDERIPVYVRGSGASVEDVMAVLQKRDPTLCDKCARRFAELHMRDPSTFH